MRGTSRLPPRRSKAGLLSGYLRRTGLGRADFREL
ncbi:MAG: hypothetical protein K0Q92_3809, partial [Steroidobacteraceae bacterium]|nr:hypothetical protein [Steroidobacteraceae bacterium]